MDIRSWYKSTTTMSPSRDTAHGTHRVVRARLGSIIPLDPRTFAATARRCHPWPFLAPQAPSSWTATHMSMARRNVRPPCSENLLWEDGSLDAPSRRIARDLVSVEKVSMIVQGDIDATAQAVFAIRNDARDRCALLFQRGRRADGLEGTEAG